MNNSIPSTMSHSQRSYQAALRRELGVLLDLMGETWGFRPDVRVRAADCLLVQADFNIQGFAHQGARLYVHGGSEHGRRSPAGAARSIATEITSHRTTCKECGLGLPNLWWRASNWGRPYQPPGERLLYDTPADALERLLHPVMARRLDQRLAIAATASGA